MKHPPITRSRAASIRKGEFDFGKTEDGRVVMSKNDDSPSRDGARGQPPPM
jgi:hypothetical protein